MGVYIWIQGTEESSCNYVKFVTGPLEAVGWNLKTQITTILQCQRQLPIASLRLWRIFLNAFAT